MKQALIYGLSTLFLVALLFQGWVMWSNTDVEEQPYELLKTYGDIEIRHYPKARLISYTSDKSSDNDGFRTLAGYIYGGNEDEMKIAMTAPVHMSSSQKESVMSFVLPQEHWDEKLPAPNNNDVKMHFSEAKDVAVIRFSGYSNQDKYNAKKMELVSALDSMGITYGSDFTLLGYDPPYKATNRRNEISVSVDLTTLP